VTKLLEFVDSTLMADLYNDLIPPRLLAIVGSLTSNKR